MADGRNLRANADASTNTATGVREGAWAGAVTGASVTSSFFRWIQFQSSDDRHQPNGVGGSKKTYRCAYRAAGDGICQADPRRRCGTELSSRSAGHHGYHGRLRAKYEPGNHHSSLALAELPRGLCQRTGLRLHRQNQLCRQGGRSAECLGGQGDDVHRRGSRIAIGFMVFAHALCRGFVAWLQRLEASRPGAVQFVVAKQLPALHNRENAPARQQLERCLHPRRHVRVRRIGGQIVDVGCSSGTAKLFSGSHRPTCFNQRRWKIQKDERGVYLPAEVTRNNGSSGITYTAYAFTTMVEALDIARYTGHDFWHCQTPEGANLQEAIEWYFRWDILKKPFPWNPNPVHFQTRKNVFEIANDHISI